jgi:Fic family protein
MRFLGYSLQTLAYPKLLAIFERLKTPILTPHEKKALLQLQEEFSLQKSHLSQTLIRKEWERFTIEYIWKSCACEGNTYSVFDTEHLIKEGFETEGKTKLEARMILNHKLAFDFVREHAEDFRVLSRALIESVHTLLMRDLGVTPNLRRTLVAITGTNYRPLANEFQIKEVLDKTCGLINAEENVFTKSLLSILLISYIQPFEDGNKRTARLIANAIMNAHSCFPLSFRSINEVLYKKAILVFYEINNIAPMRDIFLDQCLFSVKTYFRSS